MGFLGGGLMGMASFGGWVDFFVIPEAWVFLWIIHKTCLHNILKKTARSQWASIERSLLYYNIIIPLFSHTNLYHISLLFKAERIRDFRMKMMCESPVSGTSVRTLTHRNTVPDAGVTGGDGTLDCLNLNRIGWFYIGLLLFLSFLF
ncbi:uncharacterized protein F4822DRAFT_63851 [Hypoxylon trugodes]|uniref:uncharacterized protein n=1 Tax=Hypoxylon trugodes TaxID=326681 RepID=UPI00219E11D1|nr:uncharacterized protein F4822DRAFT_63851 [Hypoxylon trugodes]KAI1384218.1 hypothetical protein F4822DRAFT_63851 [Hypoxylon trugodes]